MRKGKEREVRKAKAPVEETEKEGRKEGKTRRRKRERENEKEQEKEEEEEGARDWHTLEAGLFSRIR